MLCSLVRPISNHVTAENQCVYYDAQSNIWLWIRYLIFFGDWYRIGSLPVDGLKSLEDGLKNWLNGWTLLEPPSEIASA